MSDNKPTIYLLQGENEFDIHEFLGKLQARMGDPSTAELNITRLDGRTNSLDEFVVAVSAMPFLVDRRMVILTHPTARLNSPSLQTKFTGILDNIPISTACILVEYHLLTDDRKRRENKIHWLDRWAETAGSRVYTQTFNLPTGDALTYWILERVKSSGGKINPDAAKELAVLVGDDTRLASHEIEKLLTYVNYARPIETADVQELTPSSAGVADFALINALRDKNLRQAQLILHRMLEVEEPLVILQMIVTQYRQILTARLALDGGGNYDETMRRLKIHPFAAKLAATQARLYRQETLEGIYRRLLHIDAAIKKGETPAELALDILIIDLTS